MDPERRRRFKRCLEQFHGFQGTDVPRTVSAFHVCRPVRQGNGFFRAGSRMAVWRFLYGRLNVLSASLSGLVNGMGQTNAVKDFGEGNRFLFNLHTSGVSVSTALTPLALSVDWRATLVFSRFGQMLQTGPTKNSGRPAFN